MRVASGIADLGSPFYEEERQRDVWNEASAVGFQTMLWLAVAAANVMIWVGRTAAMPYALGLLVTVGVGSFVTIAYATRSGVDVEEASQRWRPATGVFLALFATFVVGMLVSVDWNAGGFAGGMAGGAAVGSALGLVAVGGRMVWRRRRAAGQT